MSHAKPPLGLHVEITDAAGIRTRWDSGDPDARNRPLGLSFGTQRMAGFAQGSVTLPRRIDGEYVDQHLLDGIAFVGDDGSVAYEGRVEAMPRSMGDSHSVTVQTAGWIAHAADRKFTEVYVDRDLSAWTGPARARQITLVGAGHSNAAPSQAQDASDPAIVASVTGAWVSTAKPSVEAWYDAGPGNKIGSLYYEWTRGGNIDPADTNWAWFAGVSSDDVLTTVNVTANLRATGPGSGTISATGTRRYAFTQFQHNSSGGTDNAEYAVYWRKLAVFGDHGLTKRGSAPEGLYASDVLKNIAARFCPKLNTAGVQATTYAIPHLVFKEQTTPYEAFKQINAYHLWNLAVWENRTLHYGPVDLTDYDWEVRLDDEGVAVSLQGDSTEDSVYNGITVEYFDVNKGATNRITPDDDTTLKDTDSENPANKHGIDRWDDLRLSVPTTEDAAKQLARAALAEANTPKAPGTITVQGHLRDRAGHWQQGWKVRAGDTVAITNHPNDRPRLITETQWDHDRKTLTITVEGQPRRIEAVMDRLSTALDAANLT